MAENNIDPSWLSGEPEPSPTPPVTPPIPSPTPPPAQAPPEVPPADAAPPPISPPPPAPTPPPVPAQSVKPPASPKPHNILADIFHVVLALGFAGLATYLIIVGPSLWVKISYALDNIGKTNIAEPLISEQSLGGGIGGAVTNALNQPSFTITAPPAIAELNLEDNMVVIPKIDVRAPVVWNSSSDESIMLANLSKGVAHYGFTSLPNEKQGNVFLTGHSSYYWWDRSPYKTVFALLDQLVPGDQIVVQFQSKIYLYQITGSKVVEPNEVDVAQATPEPRISLMTCVPVGTALRRLIIQGTLARVYSTQTAQADLEPTI